MEWQDYLHSVYGCDGCGRYPNLFRYFEELEGEDVVARSSLDFFVRIVSHSDELDQADESEVLWEGFVHAIKVQDANRKPKGCSPLVLGDKRLLVHLWKKSKAINDLCSIGSETLSQRSQDGDIEFGRVAQATFENLSITVLACEGMTQQHLVASTMGYSNVYFPPHRMFVDVCLDDRWNDPHDKPTWTLHCNLRLPLTNSSSSDDDDLCSGITIGCTEEEDDTEIEELAENYMIRYNRTRDREARTRLPGRRWRWNT